MFPALRTGGEGDGPPVCVDMPLQHIRVHVCLRIMRSVAGREGGEPPRLRGFWSARTLLLVERMTTTIWPCLICGCSWRHNGATTRNKTNTPPTPGEKRESPPQKFGNRFCTMTKWETAMLTRSDHGIVIGSACDGMKENHLGEACGLAREAMLDAWIARLA